MADKIINSFDVWITAQGLKSQLRLRTVDNVSLEGIQRLRDLILELAIQGKLTSKDSKDEPTQGLLTKIRQEKKQLIEKGIVKKERHFAEIKDEEKPFDLPTGWEWTRIESVGHDWGQKKPKSDFNYIEVSGIDSDKGVIHSTTLLAAKDAPSRARKVVKKGTVIYSTVRPYLKNICLVDTEFSLEPIASTAFAVIHPLQSMPGKYFFYYFRSPTFVKYVESVQIGVAYPAINDTQFFGGLVPLPPLAEQHRIVAKVDELMALCDELEKQETHHLKSHQLLVETLLGTLTKASDAGEFQTSWSRLAQHFDEIFTTEDSIDKLKQTILQLAVMGKLIPQDPSDERASELLKKVSIKQQELVEQKRLKLGKSTDKPVFLLGDTQLPQSWALCKADQIFFITKLAGFEYTDHFKLQESGEVPVVRAQNVRPLVIDKSNLLYIDLKTSKLLDRCSLIKRSLLITFIGAGIGDVATFEESDRWHLAPNVAKMEPFDGCEDYFQMKFFNYFLTSGLGQREVFKHLKATAQPSLSMGTIRDIDLPIPPTAEQKRIVTKVEELLVSCDRLKERMAESQKTTNELANSVMNLV